MRTHVNPSLTYSPTSPALLRRVVARNERSPPNLRKFLQRNRARDLCNHMCPPLHHGLRRNSHRRHRNPAEGGAGGEREPIRVRSSSVHAPLCSTKKPSTKSSALLPAWHHVNRSAGQAAAPARPRTRAAREQAP